MDFLQRKPKPRPYAANSTGRPRGTLNLGSRIGRVQIYEAVGDAREIFVDKLSQAIIAHLNDNSDNLQDSASFVDLSLFMMGKSPDRTKPVVMFVSDDKQVRKEAFHLIKQSDILKDYPGFGLGEMELKAEFESLRPLGSQRNVAAALCRTEQSSIVKDHPVFGFMETYSEAGFESSRPLGSQRSSASTRAFDALSMSFGVPDKLVEVLTTKTGSLCGRRLGVNIQNVSTTNTSLAVAGGVVSYKGSYFLHSVNHFLQAAQTRQDVASRRQSLASEAIEDDCEIIGLSDDEDEDDWLVEITSNGRETETQKSLVFPGRGSKNQEIRGSDGVSTLEIHRFIDHLSFEAPSSSGRGSDGIHRFIDQLSFQAPSSSGRLVRIGQVALGSALLDSAFIQIDITETSATGFEISQLWNAAIPLESYQEHIETTPSDAAIETTTSGSIIGGTLSGTPSFVRLPNSRIFQEVYVAMLNRPLSPGDCGSWVKHAVTGRLFGHAIAGSPTTGLVLVMPAAKTFAEALATFSTEKIKLPEVLKPGVAFHVFQNALDESDYHFESTKAFDRHSERLLTANEALSVSQRSYTQLFHPPPIPAPQRPSQILWCEFSELMNCAATFPLDDEAAWIHHHIQHLRYSFPTRLMCWFCDYDHNPLAVQDPGLGHANFEDRMRHIRGHILHDHLCTREHMRPDFHVISHLHNQGLIDDFTFNHAMSYNELPDRYRLPGSHSRSSSGPNHQQSTAPSGRGQFHDLERERRAERRRQKGKQPDRRR